VKGGAPDGRRPVFNPSPPNQNDTWDVEERGGNEPRASKVHRGLWRTDAQKDRGQGDAGTKERRLYTSDARPGKEIRGGEATEKERKADKTYVSSQDEIVNQEWQVETESKFKEEGGNIWKPSLSARGRANVRKVAGGTTKGGTENQVNSERTIRPRPKKKEGKSKAGLERRGKEDRQENFVQKKKENRRPRVFLNKGKKAQTRPKNECANVFSERWSNDFVGGSETK